MLNAIFVVLIVGAVVTAAFTGRMAEVNAAWLASAEGAVELAIGLIGSMALWLGLMRVLRDAGLMGAIGRGLAPLMRRLFPDVPADHPAMAAMIMNISANMLGLGNAATPFGLKAMQELDKLNSRKGVATDSMALFLAINTSGVAVFPLGVIAIRATLGSENAGGVLLPSVLATFCSTIVAVTVARALARRRRFAVDRYAESASTSGPEETLAAGIVGLDAAEETATQHAPASRLRSAIALLVGVILMVALARQFTGATPAADFVPIGRELLRSWLLPLFMVAIVLFGFSHRVKVYESFIQGAREGFQIAVMIIPFMVAILVAVGMFRASGALEALTAVVAPATSLIGFPAEALPMALVRPLSGSGAMAVMTEVMTVNGPDSFVGYLVSVMNGSTETTFYVMALYFGSVRVRAARHTLLACLCADAVGALAALFWCRIFF